MAAVVETVHTRAQEGEYRLLPVDRIDPSSTNPRTEFDESFIAELADSIVRLGLQQPIVVRPRKKRFEIVAGEQRWRATKHAGLAEIPCMVRDLTDTEALEVQVIENDKRRDVHPLQQMEGYARLLERPEYHGDRALLAERISKSVSYVHQRLKLREASEDVRKAFRAGKIKSAMAIMIARETPARQKDLLDRATRFNWSTRQIQEYILSELRRDVAKGGFDPADATLLKGVPACGECPKLAGNCAELYEDASKTSCTDPDCYVEKQAAHLDRAVGEAKARGEELVQIRVGYDYWPQKPRWPGAIEEGSYVRIGGKTKKCDLARKALIVAGQGIGRIVPVCCSSKCAVHKDGVREDYAAKYKEDQRKAKKVADLLRVVCGRIVDALLDRLSVAPAGSTLPFEDWFKGRLEDWAEEWFARLWNDRRRLLVKRHPEWDADTIPIGTLDTPGLVRLLNEIQLAKYLDVGYEKSVSKELQEKCEAAGVDWKAIEAAVKAEIASKGKAKTAKSPKPPKKIGPVAGPFTALMAAASSADQGRTILAEHQKAVEELEERLGVPKTVGEIELHHFRGFGVMKPKDLALTVAAAWAKDAVKGPVMVDLVQDGLAMHAEWEKRSGEWGMESFKDTPLQRLLKRASALAEPWPEPSEQGVFEPRHCLRLVSTGKAGSAEVLLVRTADGWRSRANVDLDGRSTGSYPAASDVPHATFEEALLDGLTSVLFVCESTPSDSKKVKKAAVCVGEWARGVGEELRGLIGTPAADPVEPVESVAEWAQRAPATSGYTEDMGRIAADPARAATPRRIDDLMIAAMAHAVPLDVLYGDLLSVGVSAELLRAPFSRFAEYQDEQPGIVGETRPWAELDGMTQCPGCGAFLTAGAVEEHLKGCEAGQ